MKHCCHVSGVFWRIDSLLELTEMLQSRWMWRNCSTLVGKSHFHFTAELKILKLSLTTRSWTILNQTEGISCWWPLIWNQLWHIFTSSLYIATCFTQECQTCGVCSPSSAVQMCCHPAAPWPVTSLVLPSGLQLVPAPSSEFLHLPVEWKQICF